MANILLGATGSVAAIKVPELFARLTQAGHQVKVVATHAALYFFDPAEITGPCYRDEDEWPGKRYQRDDPVLHIELRRWADLFLIAPLDANTLAKLACGLADNCLTCVWRAWDPARPVVLAPAMNTLMWEHPLTCRHLRQLADAVPADSDPETMIAWINEHSAKLRIVPPVSKRLACGDVGVGAMASVEEVVHVVNELV
jgi:phosphopantothenoylcysteine decarboxylase